MIHFFRRNRNKPAIPRTFSGEWRDLAFANVPYLRLLDGTELEALEAGALALLGSTHFEGCGGLVVTDEIRVTVAVQACVPVLRRKGVPYPGLRSILVYPDAFVTPVTERLEGGLETEDEEERSGESWSLGNVILSWEDVLEGAEDPEDGYNPVFHEFAHQLDDESSDSEGLPLLGSKTEAEEWKKVLDREMRLADSGRGRSVLDPYAAVSRAECFAVATEAFFEKPVALKTRHTDLYHLLSAFYGQDTAGRRLRARGKR